MLLDREAEKDAIDGVLSAVRVGLSGVIVFRGEAGVGKSALLEYAVSSARDLGVLRAAGIESEMELGFAALHQLLAPLLPGIDRLPGPQREALGSAFGLFVGASPADLFLIGLGALTLLADAAVQRPVVCVVDDAQWLDQASAGVLGFVARRLFADRVGMLFAVREESERTVALDGLGELRVEGLSEGAARELLDSVAAGGMDRGVRERLVVETRGNPLALVEFGSELSEDELSGSTPLREPLSIGSRLEGRFLSRVRRLPADTQLLLLLAAAQQVGDPEQLWRAAELLGVGRRAADPLATDPLLAVEPQVVFRHPLVRSAVYQGAAPEPRRQAHEALAAAIDAERDPDRRAWHLAAAAVGPDEHVAAELERSAGRAQERGGLAAAAALLERSAEISPDPQLQANRRLIAAEANLGAGAYGRAQSLLDQCLPRLRDAAAHARAMRLGGAIRFAAGRGGDTPALLFDAAMELHAIDARRSREMLTECLEAAMWAGELTDGTTVMDVAETARDMYPPADGAGTADLLLRGYTERLTVGYAAGVQWWQRAVRTHSEEVRVRPSLQWHGMIWNATGELLDFEGHYAISRQRVQFAREQGALATLPVALNCLAWCELLGGRVESAEALVAEAVEIAGATGAPSFPGAQGLLLLAMLAWRGHEEAARQVAEDVDAEARERGQGLGRTMVRYFLTTLELGYGRYEAARAHALDVYETDPFYQGSVCLADVVEATIRTDDFDAARAASARLSERALASGTPWALGLMARAQALLARGSDPEALYVEALAHLGRSGVAAELARTHLLYGEWLRRRRRRIDAREQLRTAYQMLDAMGAEAFAERARVELLATGEHARRRAADTRDELTPQEQRVARLAAEGTSNQQIASQLFVSPSTVAYHLRKVFSKLGVTSRWELARALRRDADVLQPDDPFGG